MRRIVRNLMTSLFTHRPCGRGGGFSCRVGELTWRPGPGRRSGAEIRKGAYLRVVLSALTLLFCGACLLESGSASSQVAEPVKASALGALAIVPFDSLSGQPNAGLILAGLMAGALERDPRLQVIPQDLVASRLAVKEGEILPPDELGSLLKAETLLLGSVTEYRYKRGVGEEPVIGLSLRLVEARTGRILWRAERSRVGSWSLMREDSLSRLAAALCKDLSRMLRGDLRDG